MGVLGVNLLFPVIVNHYDTWRMPFIVLGVAGIIFALGLLIFGKEAAFQGTRLNFHPNIIREVFRYKQVWICYGLQFIRFSIAQGIMFWLPTLLLSEKQFSLQMTGTIIALQAIITGSFNIFIAYLSDRFKRPIMAIGVSMVMLLITTGLLVTLDSAGLVIVIVFINAVFLQAYFGPLFTLAVEILGSEKTGISNGISNMFAIFGGLSSAYLMGILKDATGSFEWGFYTICVLSAIGLILTLVLKKLRRKKALRYSRLG